MRTRAQEKAMFARLGRSMRGAERGYIPAGYRGIQVIPMEQGTSDPLSEYGSKVVAEDKPMVSQDMTKGADFLLPYAGGSESNYKEQVTVNPYKDVSSEIDKYIVEMKAKKKPEDDIIQISDEYTFEPLKAHKGPALRMSKINKKESILSDEFLDFIEDNVEIDRKLYDEGYRSATFAEPFDDYYYHEPFPKVVSSSVVNLEDLVDDSREPSVRGFNKDVIDAARKYYGRYPVDVVTSKSDIGSGQTIFTFPKKHKR